MEKKHIFLLGGVAAVGAAILLSTRSSKAAPYTPPPPQPKPAPKPALPTGSNGGASVDQIKCVQQRLNELGFNAGAVDGQYGPQTTAAVTAFQKARGVPTSGNLDAATLGTELGACIAAGIVKQSVAESAGEGISLPGYGTLQSACDVAGHMMDGEEGDRVLSFIANLTDYQVAKTVAVALANAAPPCYDLASRAMAKANELYVLTNAAV